MSEAPGADTLELERELRDVAGRVTRSPRSLNVVQIAPDEVVRLLDALASLRAEKEELRRERDEARATEGCDKRGTHRFERGGVGSHYCCECFDKVAALPAPVEPGWRPIGEDHPSPPHGQPVLLYSPPSMGWPAGKIEARPFSTGRSGPGWSEYSQHSWATHWMPLPTTTDSQGGEDA